jgi:hypothetical protein
MPVLPNQTPAQYITFLQPIYDAMSRALRQYSSARFPGLTVTSAPGPNTLLFDAQYDNQPLSAHDLTLAAIVARAYQ